MRRLNGLLRRFFEAPDGVLSPEHRITLEASLLERYDRLHPQERSMKRIVRRAAFGVAAIVGVGIVACGAPAEVGVAGLWLSVTLPAGAQLPDPEGIARIVDEKGAGEVEVRVQSTEAGTALEMTVWGRHLATTPLAPKLIAAFPALAGAVIREEPVEAKVRVSVAEKIGHDWFERELSAGNLEQAKQRLIDEIRAREGADAKIDVEINADDAGHREVKVKVVKEHVEERK